MNLSPSRVNAFPRSRCGRHQPLLRLPLVQAMPSMAALLLLQGLERVQGLELRLVVPRLARVPLLPRQLQMNRRRHN